MTSPKQLKQVTAIFNTLYSITDSLDEAKVLLEIMATISVDDWYSKVNKPYLRQCVNCDRAYLVSRTNAPQEGFCPFCDTDINRAELLRINKQIRRAIRANMPATLTFKEWKQTLHDFEGKCAYCQRFKFTDMEHFVPLKKGGGTTAHNVVPSCSYCNWRKRSRNPNKSRNVRLAPEAVQRVRLYLEGRKLR